MRLPVAVLRAAGEGKGEDARCKEIAPDLEAQFQQALASVQSRPIPVRVELPWYVEIDGHLYAFPFSGHDVGGSSCARYVIADFLASPRTHTRHPCVARQRPAPFVVTGLDGTS